MAFDRADRSRLVHERELDVLRSLSTLPDVLATACADRAPHRVTTWVRELAGAVHGFYHDCYVLGDDVAPELTQARLWLVEAAEIGLAIGARPARGRRARVDVSAIRVGAVPRLLPDSATVGPTASC